ncbi:MAG: acylphosphatase [Chthoniobacteraceae bacterium]
MIARQVFYEGKVQGVGFRYTTRNVARGYDVSGWVLNLPDGRVHLHVQGDEEEVCAFLTGMLESELNSNIRKAEEHKVPLENGLKGFEIRQ